MRSSLHRATLLTPTQNRLDVRAHALRSARVVAIGDSKTFNFGGGWFKIACQLSGKPVWGGFFATQGYTLAQIQATHLPSVLALGGQQKPAACLIDGFTNDINTAGYTLAGSQATFLAIANALAANGVTPLLATMPPRPAATYPAEIPKWNAWIRALGARRQWPVFDLYAAVANANGNWLSGMTADSIHPNGQGNRTIGAALATQLTNLFGPLGQGPTLSRTIGDASNLIASNGQLFLGTASGGIAGNWSGSGTGCVFTVDTTDATIVGAWQTVARGTAGTANAFLQLNPAVTTGFTVGDRLAFGCLYRTASFESADVNQSGYLQVNCYNSSAVILATANPISSTQSSTQGAVGVAYDEIVVPAGTVSIRVVAGINGAATTTNGSELRMAQPTLLNLTTLGAA